MFGIESSANNSFIQFLRSAVSANFIFKVSNDLNHKTDAHLREANNFLDVASICAFTDGRFCIKQRLFFFHHQNYEQMLFSSSRKENNARKNSRNLNSRQNVKYKEYSNLEIEGNCGRCFRLLKPSNFQFQLTLSSDLK